MAVVRALAFPHRSLPVRARGGWPGKGPAGGVRRKRARGGIAGGRDHAPPTPGAGTADRFPLFLPQPLPELGPRKTADGADLPPVAVFFDIERMPQVPNTSWYKPAARSSSVHPRLIAI